MESKILLLLRYMAEHNAQHRSINNTSSAIVCECRLCEHTRKDLGVEVEKRTDNYGEIRAFYTAKYSYIDLITWYEE